MEPDAVMGCLFFGLGSAAAPVITDRSGRLIENMLDVRFGVQFGMLLGRMLRMFIGMESVCMRHLRMVGRAFVIALFVVPCGFVVVMRSLRVMMGRLRMMMRCFL